MNFPNYIKKLYNPLIEIINPVRPMMKYIRNNSNENLIGVEIGVRAGKNALNILQNLDVKKLYLIDPYEPYKLPKKYLNQKQQNIYLKEAENRLKKYKYNITLIKKTSKKAIDEIPNNLDFVYIDGDHNKAREDLEFYINKVKNNGVIGGHDIDHYSVAYDIMSYCIDNNIKPSQFKIEWPDWYLIKKL